MTFCVMAMSHMYGNVKTIECGYKVCIPSIYCMWLVFVCLIIDNFIWTYVTFVYNRAGCLLEFRITSRNRCHKYINLYISEGSPCLQRLLVRWFTKRKRGTKGQNMFCYTLTTLFVFIFRFELVWMDFNAHRQTTCHIVPKIHLYVQLFRE